MIPDQEGIISTHLGERERERTKEPRKGSGTRSGNDNSEPQLRPRGKRTCALGTDEGVEGSGEHRRWESASSVDGWNCRGLHCFLNVFQVMHQSQVGYRAISLTVMFRQ